MKFVEILSHLGNDKEALKEFFQVVDEKDDAKLQDYVGKLIEKYTKPEAEKKIESSIKEDPSILRVFDDSGKVLAYFNTNNYDWVRYKGLRSKSIPYAGMIIKLEPEEILGIAKVIDSYGKYRVIIPSYKKSYISLPKEIVELIKAKTRPFGGNLDLIFKNALQREFEKLQ